MIRVHSTAKALKENSLHQSFCQRFETELTQIKEALSKKSGVKQLTKVHQRMGRLKQKSTHRYYNIDIITNGTIVTDIKWT